MSDDDKRVPDPFRAWREWFQENEQRWSETMTDVMGDDRFAKGMGRYFQEALHTHRMFTDSMAQYLGNLNLPARSDILALGDRIGQLEDAIAALQVEVRNLRDRGDGAGGSPRPRRTRRPAADPES